MLANYDIYHKIFINIKKTLDKLNQGCYYISMRIEKLNPFLIIYFFFGGFQMLNNEAIAKKAKEASQWFTIVTRNTTGEKVIALEGNYPEWVFNMVYDCHDNRPLNDWIYETVREVLGEIVEYDGDEDDARSSIEADVYDSDLADWARDFPEYVNGVMGEVNSRDYFDTLRYAQYDHKQEIFAIVFDDLQEECDNDDD